MGVLLLLQLTECDIVHNTLMALHPLQLYSRHLHEERVLIAVKLQKIIVQFGCNSILIPPIQVPRICLDNFSSVSSIPIPYGCSRYIVLSLYSPG